MYVSFKVKGVNVPLNAIKTGPLDRGLDVTLWALFTSNNQPLPIVLNIRSFFFFFCCSFLVERMQRGCRQNSRLTLNLKGIINRCADCLPVLPSE